jgi:hypothetical protein
MKLFTIMFLFLSSLVLFAQNSGNLSGKIIDAKTGETLPGVNVIIKGTYYGAATDFNGKFRIDNISVGTYNVTISLIGYKSFEYTGILIEANKTKELDIKLEETVLTLGQDVIVVGEKPLLDVEETQSKKTVSKEDLAVAVLENIKDVVSQQSGIFIRWSFCSRSSFRNWFWFAT